MKTNQIGRSMIEMLGVLAIIGVLSVGAIAGYQKAMFKHKMNKTMDMISYAVARVAELETMKVGTEIMDAADVVKYGIMPDCDVNYIDINGKTGESCPLPLGEFTIDFDFDDDMRGEFYISFLQEPFDSCVVFFNSGIYKNVPEDWWYGQKYDLGGWIDLTNGKDRCYVYGKKEFPLSQGAKSELTNQDILDACDVCKNSKYCKILWSVRNEI